MKFKVNSTIFNCGSFVKQYLAKAEEMLTEAHNRSSQKNIYNLTDTFKVLFSCFAAKIAIPKFQEAQQSFIDYMDISTKLDSERENIKQLFTLILKQEGTLTIEAKQITKLLHQRIRDNVVKEVANLCKDMLLRLVSQKIHVHGLVLHDVVTMLEKDINDENLDYIQNYFYHPFDVFRKKIVHVFDGYQDIRMNKMMREKFDAAIERIKRSLQSDLHASFEKSLTEVMCQNESIKCLGIGEKDFSGIVMPKFIAQASRLNRSYTSLPHNDKLMIQNQVRKRMEDENDIIKKLTNLITETDEVSTDITVDQQDEVKKKVINDVNNQLFPCTKLCPLCKAPCNETHPGGMSPDDTHSSGCHRPQGIATYVTKESKEFFTLFCNDLIKTDQTFSNADTMYCPIPYSNYRNVISYYKSWNIEDVAGAGKLYWKYITYQVTKNLHRFLPKAKKGDVSKWQGISKLEAIKNINSLFHLEGNTIAKNEEGFHIVKLLESLKPTVDSSIRIYQTIQELYSSNNAMKRNWSSKVDRKQHFMEDLHRRSSGLYNYERTGGKWEDELQQSKYKLYECARKNAIELLDRKKRMRSQNSLLKKLRTSLTNFGVKRYQHLRKMTSAQASSKK